ncbi:uncharacterized protein LOC127715717 isoform X2 [Mytilus californianus]|uniref:uncharacterized protein LOC127715717 isoform X2 n=1 Tax=Mytilus californianus TaxID=6549 RepID=UPI0022468AEA|nr:uncharacterized protein LOC127715717 isoform X2 [Mytilus californianus]
MVFLKAVMHAIFIINLVSSVTTEYDFKCPHESHRMIRAHWHCNTTEENYSCLKDVREDSYRESCLYKSDFVRMGQKYVIKGNRRSMNCTVKRYQPFKFYSSQLSKCAFMKSSCDEEGQLIFTAGSTKEDSTCNCDYTRGYTFLVRPRNIRFCMPEQEDCTYYLTTCPQNNGLSSDYECTQDPMSSSFVSFIVQPKSKKNETVKHGNLDAFQYNLALPTRQYRIVAVTTICVTSLIVIALVLYSRYHGQIMRMNYTKNNRDELDGHKKDFNSENNCNKEHNTQDTSGEDKVSMGSYFEDYIIEDGPCNDEDTIARCIAATIDKLEKILSNLDKQTAISIRQIVKSKNYHRKEVLDFLVAVQDILQNDNTEEMNLVAGVKLIQIISETNNTITSISGEEIDCIQIPAIVLQWLCAIRVMKIEKKDKLPDDMNSDIIAIRKKMETLDKRLTENQEYSNTLVNEITCFVENIQKKISILMESKDTCTKDEVVRVQYKSHTLINLYMDVQFLRSAYCIRYYSHGEPFTVDKHHMMLTKLRDIEKPQANFLKQFAQPTKDTVAFFALFHPSEYDCITDYMKVKGIYLQDLYDVLNNKMFAIRPQKWLQHRAVMSYTPTGTIWSAKNPDDKCSMLFEFKSLSKVDNTFLIRSVQWPSWYMYMKENAALRGQKKKTGPKREWKIVRLDNEKYMICTRKWPSKFIYMDGGLLGKVIAAYGDPGTSGYLDLIHENEIDL